MRGIWKLILRFRWFSFGKCVKQKQCCDCRWNWSFHGGRRREKRYWSKKMTTKWNQTNAQSLMERSAIEKIWLFNGKFTFWETALNWNDIQQAVEFKARFLIIIKEKVFFKLGARLAFHAPKTAQSQTIKISFDTKLSIFFWVTSERHCKTGGEHTHRPPCCRECDVSIKGGEKGGSEGDRVPYVSWLSIENWFVTRVRYTFCHHYQYSHRPHLST